MYFQNICFCKISLEFLSQGTKVIALRTPNKDYGSEYGARKKLSFEHPWIERWFRKSISEIELPILLDLTQFWKIKWGAFFRWSSSLQCSIRNLKQINLFPWFTEWYWTTGILIGWPIRTFLLARLLIVLKELLDTPILVLDFCFYQTMPNSSHYSVHCSATWFDTIA